MKKVGILTTYFASNFGAMLQPFALKRVIEGLGHDVEMIRYCQPVVESYYNPSKDRTIIKNMIKSAVRPWRWKSAISQVYLYYCYSKPILYIKDRVFKRFMLKYITDTEEFEYTWPKDKDIYFIGSDQLWSAKNMNGFDEVYFGNFETTKDSKKVTYAVSAEKLVFDQEEKNYFNSHLHNFDLISVRENSLAEAIINNTEYKNIDVTLDPTLLAESSIFDEIECINPLPNKKYVLFYQIRDCFNFTDKIYNYAKSQGVDMVIFSEQPELKLKRFESKHPNVHYFPTAGEEMFLGAMKNAECVFTPSFHGCVFSIINHTPLFHLRLDDGRDTRGINLLQMCNLDYRGLHIEDDIINDTIDYEKVDSILAKKRKESLDFVLKALSL